MFVGHTIVLVFIVSSFLLAEHHLTSYKRGQAQNFLGGKVIANNAQDEDACRAKELLFFRPMDINSASCEELTLLPGIGEVTACRVVEFRQSLGFLISVEEFKDINSPVGPKLLGAISPYLFHCQNTRSTKCKRKSSATKSQRHKRALILKPYQKEKKKVVDTVYAVH